MFIFIMNSWILVTHFCSKEPIFRELLASEHLIIYAFETDLFVFEEGSK